MGLKEPRTVAQDKDMDEPLKFGLWNVLHAHYYKGTGRVDQMATQTFVQTVWRYFLKQRVDDLPPTWQLAWNEFRGRFFGLKWHEVYGLLEFIVGGPIVRQLGFQEDCTRVLEEEMSAFRFVGTELLPITNPEEIAECEAAMRSPFPGSNVHLEEAVALFKDRESPDYRN